MEGTRHERVVVLIAAYIIGFITAYIAFGVVKVQDIDYVALTNQNASIIASQSKEKSSDIFVGLDNEGLVLIKNNKRILLSLKNNGEVAPAEGVHASIVTYSASPDNSKIYFCEQPTVDSDSCRPYIYSVDDGIVYPVTVKGERVAFPVEGHAVSWNEGGELVVE
jgi:hypothetical protein